MMIFEKNGVAVFPVEHKLAAGSAAEQRIDLLQLSQITTNEGNAMSTAIRINDDIYVAAQRVAGAERRSIPQQIEFWAQVGKTALPIEFVRELLISKHTDRALAEPFQLKAARKSAPAARATRKRA
jgi:hypothetical protein